MTDNLQHCANARTILSSLGPIIHQANGSKDKENAANAVSMEYMKKVLGFNQQTVDSLTEQQLVGNLKKSLMNAVLQLNAVNEVGQDAKSQTANDFMKMVHVEKLVVRLQAKFRQKLAMRKLEKDVEKQKARLAKRAQQAKGTSNEEMALQEFKQRLSKKGLTPEAFFRTCDPEYKRTVPVERFKSMLNNFNLQLSRGQVSRLTLILDEDMEGNITVDEYYNALEAYNCSGEKHFATDGSDYYVSFEHRAMFKLLQILKERTISSSDLFRACDVNDDKDVNIRELEAVLTGFSAEFYQKDCQAIHNFFDIDKNNTCTEQEFMGQIAKAERQLQQHNDRKAGRSGTAGSLRGTMDLNDRDEGMNAYIPRYNQSSPRTQTDLLTDYMIQQFSEKNIQPMRIFSMADKRRAGQVKFSDILEAMLKCIPSFTREFVDQIPYAFQQSPSDMISKEEFDMMFNIKAQMSSSAAGPQVSALKKKNAVDKTSPQDNFAILKYLAESIEKEGLTAARLFKAADKNFNQVLTIEELKEQVKISLPDYFAGLNFKKLLKAFDLNGNGLIEQEEFVRMLDMAWRSGVDTTSLSKNANAMLGRQKTMANTLGKSAKSVTLPDTVHAKDKMDSTKIIQAFKGLLACENRLQDPLDEIQLIFEKITRWKIANAPDGPEAQEAFVTKTFMDIQKKQKVKIHNIITCTELLKTFQQAANLTDDDIMLITYTSLDHEFFTNGIILQGEFLKWFNLDFGDPDDKETDEQGQDEIDFLENKQEAWMATTTLAMEVITWFGRIQENHEVILTSKWWQKLRYFHFGNEMKECFEQKPELMTELRKIFKDQNDKCTYFDCFQFIEHKMEIKLESWEEDALESRLDRLGMAFIEFNEFNEFSMEYNINWNEKLAENDLEDILDAEINLSYKDYTIVENDYFQGCKTMFRKEKAALAACRKIWKQMKKAKDHKYFDPDFGPKDDNDIQGNILSLYTQDAKPVDQKIDPETGKPYPPEPKTEEQLQAEKLFNKKNGTIPQKGYPLPEDIVWRSAVTAVSDAKKKEIELKNKNEAAKNGTQSKGFKMEFVDGGASAADCTQGELGDCWFISALGVCATRDSLLMGGRDGMTPDPDMIVDKEIAMLMCNGIYPPIFHKYRTRGLYVHRFFKNMEWIYVLIDDRLPLSKKENKLVFGHSDGNPQEMWVSLIEKAYAKLHGCYGNLISGYIDEGVQELTGFQPEKVLIRNEKTGAFPHRMIENYGKDKDGFWKFLYSRKKQGCLLGCSIKSEKNGAQVTDGVPTGLINNHAYGLESVIEIDDKFDPKRPIRLIQLRNPWGHTEWTGAWSDGSPEITKYKDAIKEYLDSLPESERFELGGGSKEETEDGKPVKGDGKFLMHYSDWKDNFSTLFLNIDFPEDWTGVRFRSEWTKQNSGGLPNSYTKDVLERYAHNPQFMIECAKDSEIMFSMTQLGGRLPLLGKNGEKSYCHYPFQERLNYANISVFKLDYGEKYLKAFDRNKAVLISPIKREKENTGRIKLQGGQIYVLVPSTEMQGVTGEVFISIYIDQKARDCEIKRVFHPNDKNEGKDEILPYFIPEEAEKSGACPSWKLELVRNMLPYMMTDEDNGAPESSDGDE